MQPLPIRGLSVSRTDQKVIDQILSEKRTQVAQDWNDEEYFELFAAQQVLRNFPLDLEEIESGIVGGGNDGGIDSFYLIVNGKLIRDSDSTRDLKNLKQNIVMDL